MTAVHVHEVTTGEYALKQTTRPNGDHDIIICPDRIIRRGGIFIDPETDILWICDWQVRSRAAS